MVDGKGWLSHSTHLPRPAMRRKRWALALLMVLLGLLVWPFLKSLPAKENHDDAWYLNQRDFKIPIRIRAEKRVELKELRLYVSSDLGQTWDLQEKGPPDKEFFAYVANKDGTYWFTVATVNLQGDEKPNPYKMPPMQKVVVDTTRPEVSILSAKRRGADVLVTWHVREDHPDQSSLRIDYRTADMPEGLWSPVPYLPGGPKQASFRPVGAGEVQVRVQAVDLACNRGEATQPVGEGRRSSRTSKWSAPSRPGSVVRDEAVIPASGTARSSLPGLKVVNKRQVKLDFTVRKIGASGLGEVAVYVTNDEGNTWERVPVGPDCGQALEKTGPAKGPCRGSVPVNLASEGMPYGFCVVVKSVAGRGKAPPQRGDTPQVRVELDTTPPLARLYAPAEDPEHPDALILAWTASDRNLAANGIVLEWAERKEGPWSPVSPEPLANNLPDQLADGPEKANTAEDAEDAAPAQSLPLPAPARKPTGFYSWRIPEKMPPKVYLKLSVRDTAGNVAVAEMRESVSIDLAKPEVDEVTVNTGD